MHRSPAWWTLNRLSSSRVDHDLRQSAAPHLSDDPPSRVIPVVQQDVDRVPASARAWSHAVPGRSPWRTFSDRCREGVSRSAVFFGQPLRAIRGGAAACDHFVARLRELAAYGGAEPPIPPSHLRDPCLSVSVSACFDLLVHGPAARLLPRSDRERERHPSTDATKPAALGHRALHLCSRVHPG